MMMDNEGHTCSFLSRHRSAETQCWMRRYVRGTYVRTWYVRRFSQCARASAACMLYTLNRVSNVFIACKYIFKNEYGFAWLLMNPLTKTAAT